MGVIDKVIGGPAAVGALGQAAKGVAEIFVPSATRRMELSAEAQMAALRQLGEEYQHPALSWFDRMINGLNRMPRPLLAFGTLGLFIYAMVDPIAFAHRMVGLNAVPEPLWWLLGAIVAFYFGARETWYFRNRGVVSPYAAGAGSEVEDNAALQDWRIDTVHMALNDAADELHVGMGKVAQPLRVAITGSAASPSIDVTVYLAGRERALERIDDALARIGGAG